MSFPRKYNLKRSTYFSRVVLNWTRAIYSAWTVKRHRSFELVVSNRDIPISQSFSPNLNSNVQRLSLLVNIDYHSKFLFIFGICFCNCFFITKDCVCSCFVYVNIILSADALPSNLLGLLPCAFVYKNWNNYFLVSQWSNLQNRPWIFYAAISCCYLDKSN